MFYEFSKIDRQLAHRVLELTALHGLHFKNYQIDVSIETEGKIIIEAVVFIIVQSLYFMIIFSVSLPY